MPELLTEDMLSVEIVRAGGPYFGTGSPKGGDFVTVEQLLAAAASFAELRDELRPPIKLGHNDEQKELAAAGFLNGDGAPAAGWLDGLRVEGARLLADFRGVPRVVAALVRAGAYRARSVELWRNYADTTGKRHPMVITGVALLGAKLPAVRGLADLVKLYGEADPAQDAEARRFYIDADPGAPADEASTEVGATEGPTDGTDANPPSEGGPAPSPTPSAPVAVAPDPTGSNQEGTMPDTIAPELRAALGVKDDAAGIDVVTAAAVKLGEDAAATEAKLATAEARIVALEANVAAAADADTRHAALASEVETLKAAVKLGETASADLAAIKRDGVLDTAISERRLLPAQRADWSAKYDANPELVTELLATLTPRSDFAAGEAGSDDKGAADAEQAKEDATYKEAFGEAPREPATDDKTGA